MTTAKPQCFVHIGAPKTGSTALQRFLCENRAALADRGVLYPDVSLRGYGHHDLAFLLAGGYPDWAMPQPRLLAELLTDLRNAVSAHDGSILLSSEDFYLFPAAAALRDALSEAGALLGRCATIIVYVRRQDQAHESWYNQTVKAQGASHSFAESVDRWREVWNYEARLAEWADVFGETNVVVRPYEESQFSGHSLIADWLAVIGVDLEGLVMPSEETNTRLNRDLLEFQRLVNRLPLSSPEKRRFFRQLMALSGRSQGLFDDTPVLDTAQRRKIVASYAESNLAVARRFLGRNELFGGIPEAGGADAASWPGLTVEKLAYISGWLMVGDTNPG